MRFIENILEGSVNIYAKYSFKIYVLDLYAWYEWQEVRACRNETDRKAVEVQGFNLSQEGVLNMISKFSGSYGGLYENEYLRDVAPCSLVEIDRRCRDAYCLYHQRDRRPDDGGSKHL
jgi:hypothetical protein